MVDHDTRLVYSTEKGKICPACGQAAAHCACRQAVDAELAYGVPVADDQALEAPFLPQHVAQEELVCIGESELHGRGVGELVALDVTRT